jgi:exodeoxyribonuclease-3
MKVITLNVGGIKQAVEKGFLEWLQKQDADVVCVQDVRTKAYKLGDAIERPEGWEGYFFDAEQDDFAGTGIYCRTMPKAIMTGLGFELADREGRFIQADFDKVSVCSFQMPSGINPAEKKQFMEQFLEYLTKLRRKRREYIICGSWNIAHKTLDLANWQDNQLSIGFRPEERAWMDQVFGPLGYIDAFREVNRDADQYSFWPSMELDRERQEGWRLDYQVVGPNLRRNIKKAWIDPSVKFSAHAPVYVEYDL